MDRIEDGPVRQNQVEADDGVDRKTVLIGLVGVSCG